MAELGPAQLRLVPLKIEKVRDAFKKKTEMWDIVPKGGRGSKPDPKFFTMFKWDIEG